MCKAAYFCQDDRRGFHHPNCSGFFFVLDFLFPGKITSWLNIVVKTAKSMKALVYTRKDELRRNLFNNVSVLPNYFYNCK